MKLTDPFFLATLYHDKFYYKNKWPKTIPDLCETFHKSMTQSIILALYDLEANLKL